MRSLCALLFLLGPTSAVLAEDFVHLDNGGILRGSVIEESETSVTVELGAGQIVVPRRSVRLVERDATRRAPRRVVTQRDEWFLVLSGGRVVGWRRVVATRGPEREQVEERTVLFRQDGGEEVDTRRVEICDREGRPDELLWMETLGGHRMNLVTGQAKGTRLLLSIKQDGERRQEERVLPQGWALELPAWSRFQAEAAPDARCTITVFDPARLRAVTLLLRRERDAGDPRPGMTRACRSLSRAGKVAVLRALYRPGEGALSEELGGGALVARRTSRERVELARRAHPAPERPTVEEALAYPFHKRRPVPLERYHAQAGLALRLPDKSWSTELVDREIGRVLALEKPEVACTAEVFVYPLPSADADVRDCLEHALARLRLTAKRVKPLSMAQERVASGCPALVLHLAVHHRGEDLRCLAAVVRAPDRYVLLLGAAPGRHWSWAQGRFLGLLDSLVVAD